MKLMTLNVWQGRLERVLLKELKNQNVDIACMQEAIDYDGGSGGLATSYKVIGNTLGATSSFFSKLNSLPLGKKELGFGNVIFSKHELIKQETVFTRGDYKNNFDFDNDDYNVRAFQHVVIDVDSTELHVLNHHGHHIDQHKLGDDETERQVQLIADYVQSLNGPVILVGDFNLAPESKSIHILDAFMRNLSTEHGLKTTRSALTSKNEVCDYIFVNDKIKVNSFAMLDTIISDHNALLLDFSIQ